MTLMPEDSCQRLLDGCQRIGAVADSSIADMWEVFAIQSYGAEVEIEAGKVSLAGGGGEGGFGLRILNQGKVGFAYAANSDNSQRLVDAALSAASLVPSVEGFEFPDDEGETKISPMWDAEVDNVSPEQLMLQADSMLSTCKDFNPIAVITGGGISASCTAGALLTSQGISTSGMHSSHGGGIQVTIDEDDKLTSGWSSMQSFELLDDLSPICDEAVKLAEITRNTITDNEGAREAPVLFTHGGIRSLFSNVFASSLRGEKMARGESVWSGKISESVFDSHLSIHDDGTIEGGAGSGRRDGEGRKTQRTTLIERGVLKSGIWSTRDAAEQISEGNIEYARSTGNAGRGGHQSSPYTSISNFILSSSQGSNSRDSVIEEMEDGWVVHSVMGAHTANPSSGDFSVTSSSILKVVNGEIIGALKQAGVSGNLPKAFREGVSLIEMDKPRSIWASGSVVIPDILLRNGIRINPS